MQEYLSYYIGYILTITGIADFIPFSADSETKNELNVIVPLLSNMNFFDFPRLINHFLP